MRERDLFLAALQIPDPAGRDVYLDRECAGDVVLRAKVGVLLEAHRRAGAFLEKPAAEQLAARLGERTEAESPLPGETPDSPPGTGPSCSTSAQIDDAPGIPACANVPVVEWPFAMWR